MTKRHQWFNISKHVLAGMKKYIEKDSFQNEVCTDMMVTSNNWMPEKSGIHHDKLEAFVF